MLDQGRLKRLLSYDNAAGVFTCLERTSNRRLVGKAAGTINKTTGYLIVGVDGVQYQAHRLAWLYMTGRWPAEEIDHINGVRDDNKWGNLREASRVLNAENMHRARVDNSTGLLGVRKMRGKFQANIRVGGRSVNCGTYPTPELAHEAYLAAKRSLHRGCTL